MFSSFASLLPSLRIPDVGNNNHHSSPSPSKFQPADSPEEEAYNKQHPVEDESSAKKEKTKLFNETFIVVRPPPAKTNHPLNLQIQLVPPTARNRRQSNDSSDGGNSTSISLTRTISNRSDTSSYGSTASFSSTNSASSTRRTIIPLYNLQAHNVMTNVIVDAGTDAKVAKFLKRGIELIDVAILEPVEVWSEPQQNKLAAAAAVLALRNSRPATPDPSAHITTAESSVVSLHTNNSHLKPLTPTPTINVNLLPVPPASPAPSSSSKRNLFGKMFKKKDNSNNNVTSPPPSPSPSRFSPSNSPLQLAKSLSPDPNTGSRPSTAPTPRPSRGHARNLSAALSPASISEKLQLRHRSSSPNPRAMSGLGLLQVPSIEDSPQGQGQGNQNQNYGYPETPTTATATATPIPMPSAANAGTSTNDEGKILRPPILGIQPTLSYCYVPGTGTGNGTGAPEPLPIGSLSKSARALMYVWFVRRWIKRRADDTEGGGLLGLVRGQVANARVGIANAGRGGNGNGNGGSSNGSGNGSGSGSGNGAGNGHGHGHGHVPAGEGVEGRFEWKRSSGKGKGRARGNNKDKGRGRRERGKSDASEPELRARGSMREKSRDPDRERPKSSAGGAKLSHRLSIASHHSVSTTLTASEDGQHQRERDRSSTRDERDRDRSSYLPADDANDGEDSDPEDSETPWTCTLKIRRTNPGTTGSTLTIRSRRASAARPKSRAGRGQGQQGDDVDEEELGALPQPAQVLRLKVGTLSPTPHHPKVIAMLKVPFPLPDIEVERMEAVKRPAPDDTNKQPQYEGLTLKAEEIKDIVCSTAMWLAVREGFGGVGIVSRKGDGWRIRA
ncbi:hypothetical protein H0H92_002174 [Tricholoma furcatifolium]|nr:hypothetical protein H0H92_002174 [Tricholoma furcatifolium]